MGLETSAKRLIGGLVGLAVMIALLTLLAIQRIEEAKGEPFPLENHPCLLDDGILQGVARPDDIEDSRVVEMEDGTLHYVLSTTNDIVFVFTEAECPVGP